MPCFFCYVALYYLSLNTTPYPQNQGFRGQAIVLVAHFPILTAIFKVVKCRAQGILPIFALFSSLENKENFCPKVSGI